MKLKDIVHRKNKRLRKDLELEKRKNNPDTEKKFDAVSDGDVGPRSTNPAL